MTHDTLELSVLIHKFAIKGRLVTVIPIGGGNINDTYLAIFRNTFEEQQVILQRINVNVFPNQRLKNDNNYDNFFDDNYDNQ